MFTFYCAGLLWYHIGHTLLYTNPGTLYYSENMCTNQEATSTSDKRAVNASHVQEYSSRPQFFNLNFVEDQISGDGAKSLVCRCALKTISKCN